MQAVQISDYKPGQIDLRSWSPQAGLLGEPTPDEVFVRYDENAMTRGDALPSIQTFHGHFIPFPKVLIKYVGRGNTFLKCIVTFLKPIKDEELGLLTFKEAFTVPAWQGDNNIIHLMEELPGEDEQDVDVSYLLASVEDIDADYIARIRMLYPDEEITRLAPELWFEPDPAAQPCDTPR